MTVLHHLWLQMILRVNHLLYTLDTLFVMEKKLFSFNLFWNYYYYLIYSSVCSWLYQQLAHPPPRCRRDLELVSLCGFSAQVFAWLMALWNTVGLINSFASRNKSCCNHILLLETLENNTSLVFMGNLNYMSHFKIIW